MPAPGGFLSRRLTVAAILLLALASIPFRGLDPWSSSTPVATAAQPPTPPAAIFEKGDHVSIIGNTLADRMQHDGWLETVFHARHPDHHLVFRNLGFSGDEVGGYTDKPEAGKRMRSANFGSGDTWLKKCETDVILAFFGYGESYAGAEGVEKFKADLESFIKHTRAQNYNGKSAPRIVLFSPIAFENHKSPNLPTGEEQNKNLELYTMAMADVAAKNSVQFVDLYHPTFKLYTEAKSPLTINGVHLTPDGNRQLAMIIDRALYVEAPNAPNEKLRAAVNDKNFHWFERYRTTDGYSIFGGRADLRFVGGQTNRVVAQREMEVLDEMTANRDKIVWAAAQGKDIKPDDSKLPPFVPVVTNKPGKGPGGRHLFLSGEDGIQSMTIGKGMKVTLFADEKMFPELVNPVQMAWDTKGRLWVAVWPTYPHWKPSEPMNDKLLVFEDTDGDGKADKMTVFADGLHNPTGFEFANGGVLVAQAPDLLFLKDTDGDGKADYRERVISGLDSADTHHTSNSFALDPSGAVYFQEGTFHNSQVETPYGPTQRVANGSVFRYEPRTRKFEVYVTTGFANPHGHAFDRWGRDVVVDGTGASPYDAALFSGYLPFPQKHPKPPQVYQQRTRPCPGMEYLSSRHFPPEFDGNLLVANVIGFQGILRYKILEVGGSFRGEELEPILSSTDPNFRPADVKTGPDGAIYFCDWHNPIIGHMQHNLRDPSRGREHGRIYKVTYEGRQLSTSPPIAGASIPALLEVLKHPEDRVRVRARTELGALPTDAVMQALNEWVKKLDPSDAEYEHHRLEALWLRQAHNVVDLLALESVLRSPDHRARAAAVRVLCCQRDRIPEALDLLKSAAADVHPRVRVEAIRAASFFNVAEAAEIVFIASDKPTDLYLDFIKKETMKALEPILKKAIADKRDIKFTTPSGARYFLKAVATDDLLKMERTPAVYLELLFRPSVRDEFRREALTGLAKQEGKPELAVLVNAIRARDESAATEESVAFDLIRVLTSRPQPELAAARGDLEKLALGGRTALTRELGFVALIAADGSVDPAWAVAGKSLTALQDLVAAVPMVRDPGQRAALYPKVESLLGGLPPELTGKGTTDKSVKGRYVRIEIPGKKKTLTLAEVEVYSDGRNVARQGKATQINEAFFGAASRAIDGVTSGVFGDKSSSHTQEGIDDPWWEVDLGRETTIEKIVVYNRTDGNYGSRLNNFTVRVLDEKKKTIFQSVKNPAPAVKAEIAIGTAAPDRTIRRAAMLALTGVRGKEADAFKAIAKFVADDAERVSAVRALLRIPAKEWPKDLAPPLLAEVMRYMRSLPIDQRTTPVALDMMQLGDGLANLLPPDQAKAARKELGDIGVRVIRVGTLTDQMLFDKDRMAVQSGKPVEFVFENTDIMPHNFVIAAMGTLEEVGNAAEAFGTQPGAAEKHYVPPMPGGKILLASKLLQPLDQQQLKFTAPKEPGIYPYVCTYPGHWRRMHGALYVVADLDEYLADPTGYLTKNPLPVKDDLLKFNRPRTEWKLEELVDAVKETEAKGGRNFANGKQIFTVATCIACHKIGGQGNEFGPDITKLDPKIFPNASELLKHVLEPSLRIEDRYATYQIALSSGRTVTGMIVEEKDGVVKLIENPLASAKPLEIKAEDIELRKKAPTSMMPKGLLDKLTRDEILDLLAYILAKGDPKDKLFQGGHDHRHKH